MTLHELRGSTPMHRHHRRPHCKVLGDINAEVTLRRRQLYVKHSVGEYVNEQAHINGIESFWAMLKRAYKETFHKVRKKQLYGYIDELAMTGCGF